MATSPNSSGQRGRWGGHGEGRERHRRRGRRHERGGHRSNDLGRAWRHPGAGVSARNGKIGERRTGPPEHPRPPVGADHRAGRCRQLVQGDAGGQRRAHPGRLGRHLHESGVRGRRCRYSALEQDSQDRRDQCSSRKRVMGTVVSLAIREAGATTTAATTRASGAAATSRGTAAAARQRAIAVLHHVDQVFSTWQPDSPVSRLRRGEISLERRAARGRPRARALPAGRARRRAAGSTRGPCPGRHRPHRSGEGLGCQTRPGRGAAPARQPRGP